jgi:alkanesulfonate monooxygenase SsuD/methylene tetrahydromethanopterin reductase-like flavin-dependent oxidoreductase (luciferase family)
MGSMRGTMPGVATSRQSKGVGFALRDALPWRALSGIVRAAEPAGYGAVFLPEISGRDALVTLGMLAGETRDLFLGTGVVPMRSRTPLVAAMGAATVHERSGGRLILGLGTGEAGAGALDELRETVGQIRTLLEGETLELGDGPQSLSLPPDSPVPIWVSALGPRAMRLAGEIADGVILNWCPPERVPFARARIAEGAESSGRDPSSITVAVYVRAWVGGDEAEAMSSLRAMAGQYASYRAYRRQFEQVGLGPQAAVAGQAHRAGRPEDVPEVLVRSVCAVGDGARDRLDAFREAGADMPIVYPIAIADPAASIEATLRALAPA